MKIAILSQGYPSEYNRYNYAFVHRRATLYQQDHDIRVFVGSQRFGLDYEFEGVPVSVRSDAMREAILSFDPDVLFVHAPLTGALSHGPDMLRVTSEVGARGIPTPTWLHGYEAISRRKYYPSPVEVEFRENGVKSGLMTAGNQVVRWAKNRYQLREMKAFLETQDERGYPTVFVSEWLRDAVADSVGYEPTNAHVIPNPIDEDLFEYTERQPEDVTEMLSIRSFGSRKYANDVSIRAVGKLERGHLDLYGQGRLLDRCRRLSDSLDANVTFHPRFLSQPEIASLHDEYGIYLSPSRTDAQGVSMCEAMASGLPVVTSPIGGIPEFVEDGETGFLCETPDDIATRITYLQDNPDEMVAMGRQAAQSIREKCSSSVVTARELELGEEYAE